MSPEERLCVAELHVKVAEKQARVVEKQAKVAENSNLRFAENNNLRLLKNQLGLLKYKKSLLKNRNRVRTKQYLTITLVCFLLQLFTSAATFYLRQQLAACYKLLHTPHTVSLLESTLYIVGAWKDTLHPSESLWVWTVWDVLGPQTYKYCRIVKHVASFTQDLSELSNLAGSHKMVSRYHQGVQRVFP